MISPAQLASMQAAVAASLPDRCSILRNQPEDDGQGGWTDSYQDVATRVPCRLARIPTQTDPERATSGVLLATQQYRLYLPAGTDLRPADRVSVNGLTLEVDERVPGLSNPVQLVAQCRLVE